MTLGAKLPERANSRQEPMHTYEVLALARRPAPSDQVGFFFQLRVQSLNIESGLLAGRRVLIRSYATRAAVARAPAVACNGPVASKYNLALHSELRLLYGGAFVKSVRSVLRGEQLLYT